MKSYSTYLEQWETTLIKILSEYDLYAPIIRDEYQDYELMTADSISDIVYNQAKPSTPLKAFFFPIKENVVLDKKSTQQRVILGAPACDLVALKLLDKIFLDEEFLDPYYQQNRNNTILIGTDCYKTTESCHCVAYGVNPYPEEMCDINLSVIDGKMIFQPLTQRGGDFLGKMKDESFFEGDIDFESREMLRKKTVKQLKETNKELPGNEETRDLILSPETEVWQKHAARCVSCGACAAICPTCHCFLLIDRHNFEKVKNWDTCQYPAFERVAAGEDPLKKIYKRLKNRYLCKFVHKPDMFGEIACTGCGRCIDACIGKIDKNEVIIELSK